VRAGDDDDAVDSAARPDALKYRLHEQALLR
jgi:hypothetical protein